MPNLSRVGPGSAAHTRAPEASTGAGQAELAVLSHQLQSGGPLKALSRGVGAGMIRVIDSIDISASARTAARLAQKDAELTNSSGSPATVRGVHPVIDGNAEIRQSQKTQAGRD